MHCWEQMGVAACIEVTAHLGTDTFLEGRAFCTEARRNGNALSSFSFLRPPIAFVICSPLTCAATREHLTHRVVGKKTPTYKANKGGLPTDAPLDAPLTGGLRAAFVPLHAAVPGAPVEPPRALPVRPAPEPCRVVRVSARGGGQREAERPHSAKLQGSSDVTGRRQEAGGELLGRRRTRSSTPSGGEAARAAPRAVQVTAERRPSELSQSPRDSARLFVQVRGTAPLGAFSERVALFHTLRRSLCLPFAPPLRPPPLLVGGGARGRTGARARARRGAGRRARRCPPAPSPEFAPPPGMRSARALLIARGAYYRAAAAANRKAAGGAWHADALDTARDWPRRGLRKDKAARGGRGLRSQRLPEERGVRGARASPGVRAARLGGGRLRELRALCALRDGAQPALPAGRTRFARAFCGIVFFP